MHNVGDIAMLQVAVRRLRARFPRHAIDVVTGHAPRLLAEIPGVSPVCWRGGWLSAFGLPDVPGLDVVVARRPYVGHAIDRLGGKFGLPAARGRSGAAFARRLPRTELVVASGGGYVADDFATWTTPVLENLGAARAAGIPVAMLGQGLGPVEPGTEFHALASAIVGAADRVFVREATAGPALLRAWGFPQNRMRMTGDDALVAAAAHRLDPVGLSVGVNVRAARYTGIGDDVLGAIGQAVDRLSTEHGAPIASLPISRVSVESDYDVVRSLLGDHPRFDTSPAPTTAEGVMARTATCRIVVATSYHAAVFALACGIPAVCVVATPYYGAKMGGLADQFGPACTVVPAVGEEFPDRLQSAMRSAWNAAPELRTACRTVADARIADAEAAYDTLSSLVA